MAAGLLGAVLLALGGCLPAQHEAAEGPLTPWPADSGAPQRPSTAALAQPCPASWLRVVGAGFRFAAAESGGVGAVTLRNAGPRACRLTGRPDVRVVGAVPAPRQRQLPLPAQPPQFPAAVEPDTLLLATPPGAAATLEVQWRNWCVPRSSAAPRPPRSIRLTLPSGAGIDVGYDAVPPCVAPDSPSTVGVRPLRPASPPATPPWTTSVVPATIQPLGGARLTGRRGETARFAVELRNPSTAAIRFDRCPLVAELLAPAGQPEVHRLNCAAAAAAGGLAPGGRLRFEMRVAVPADAPTGVNALFWALDPTGSQRPQAQASLMVAAR